MKRLGFTAITIVALATGAAACSDAPVQPRQASLAASTAAPLFSTSSTSFVSACQKIVSPSTLCLSPTFRAALCAAIAQAGSTEGVKFVFLGSTYIVRAAPGTNAEGTSGLVFTVTRVTSTGERFVTSFFVADADIARLECQ